MASTATNTRVSAEVPSAVQFSRLYLSHAAIETTLAAHAERGKLTETKESHLRLSACSWMYTVGKSLRFPVRTIGTAMMVYHRFLLVYSSTAFAPNDVSAACLLVASKIEDTSKKARDVLIASHNVRNPNGPELNTESPVFEEQRRRTLGLERMILETQCFDFRSRHPQFFIIKFSRRLGLDAILTKHAWQISIDAYRTWIPLQLPPHVIALACLVLSCNFSEHDLLVKSEEFQVQKQHLYVALEGLLDLYLHSRSYTTAQDICSEATLMEIKSSLIRDRSNANGQPSNGSTGEQRSERNLFTIGDRGTCRYLLDSQRMRNDKQPIAPL